MPKKKKEEPKEEVKTKKETPKNPLEVELNHSKAIVFEE